MHSAAFPIVHSNRQTAALLNRLQEQSVIVAVSKGRNILQFKSLNVILLLQIVPFFRQDIWSHDTSELFVCRAE